MLYSTDFRLAALLKASPLPALETRILVGHVLQLTRVQLITQSERVLSPAEIQVCSALLQRRTSGEPIAYLTGKREFYGLELEVTPAVLIPRPETELLVDLTLQQAAVHSRVLDLGTGSGAIAIALAHSRADLIVSALDVSAAALLVAARNVQRFQVAVRLLNSDWYQALGTEKFDWIVANPPYIIAHDQHLSEGDLRFEPLDALTDHQDGLAAYRNIIGGAARHLQDGGHLLLEHGYDQADAVRRLLAEAGFEEINSWRDLADIERVSGGHLFAG